MQNNYDFDFDMSIMPNEFRLLVEIMKMQNNKSIGSFKELLTNTDWEFFLQLAMHHRVYPLIYSKLKKVDERLIPKYVIENLYQEYKKNTFKMLFLTAEMEKIGKILDGNQIRSLFLKGPVIAFDIYGDISLRTSKDLDILVQKTDLNRVEEQLLSYGYEREVQDKIEKSKLHIAYFHPQKKIQIEIHWRLNPPPLKEPSFNELWNRKRVSTLTTHQVYFLGEEDLFLFLIAHGSRHCWFRLRWLADIDQIIRNKVISSKNSLSIKAYQHQHLGGKAHILIDHALILASVLMKTPINKEMYSLAVGKRSEKLVHLAINSIIENGHLEINYDKFKKNQSFSVKTNLQRTFNLILYEFSLKSSLQKFIYILKLLKPSSADLKTLKLPKYLYFLYYPLHPFLWFWRKTTSQ
ncbi:nucleotidyltransferase domain-containing protein [Peribacillus butanolivorans]|uniref:nucleotidyltransferase domain-containing protein n=1 Tax=Peribacillus butanolivorans TaxID=421767 RepID=UPI00366DFE89